MEKTAAGLIAYAKAQLDYFGELLKTLGLAQ